RSDRSPRSLAWFHPRRPLSGHFTCYVHRTYYVLTTSVNPSVSLASENVRFFKQVKCPVCLSNRNHPVVVVVAVGKCESRVVCGICKRGGKVVFLTFPPCVFSTALTCFLVSGVKSF